MSKIEKMAFDPFDINNSFRFHTISEDQVETFLKSASEVANFFVEESELSVPEKEMHEYVKDIKRSVESHNRAHEAFLETTNIARKISAYTVDNLSDNPYLGSDDTRRRIVKTAVEKSEYKKSEAFNDVQRTNSLLVRDLQQKHT